MEKQRITLYVVIEVWRRFRSACVQRGLSASEVVERLMRKQLEEWDQKS